ncbi:MULTISPECIES: LuxR family transcriptional regulator [Brenneria]|uniref:LuxR family transcriptional regulator n=1 Tax=Brenneria nigrifluens DSM 30175 = ATCC 13028 TaxID=1121120 RepID=A0A2U1URY1_9GAMM|nr:MULTISPECIES: LuxR family transcriptional regulator [Brenneria]EHD21004.1 transcriptional regulator, LuxR family [Brenneria sp. EniD312]PWC24430.1 LuxR family transcriptional regulator [Brenneria nigrifluens DSM 30175 = ATCC 13028]QCR04159.1 LuxR family transcriptional regulator [Brenneria nigrifluens DSM 30175 = ATCC 13028]
MFSVFVKNQIVIDTLRDYIDRKLSLPGSSKYAYTVVSKKNPSEILIISNYPDEWVELYRLNNFQLIDPVILTAFKRSSAFAWDENITLMSDLKFTKIFSLSRQYNIVNGFTFVLHDHFNNLSLLSVIIGNREQGELEEYLSSERGVLQTLLIDINEQMYRLARSASSDRQQNDESKNKAIFTPRENEVLYWASMGKTYADIAAIAGISVSTVKFHMGNVVIKLGVSNARQAIRLGVELDLIMPAATAAR